MGRAGIVVIAECLPDGRITGLVLDGHAGLAPAGSDVLCAAVSVLAEYLGLALEDLLGLTAIRESANGRYVVRVDRERLSAATELLFNATLHTLERLAGQFPERLRVSVSDIEQSS